MSKVNRLSRFDAVCQAARGPTTAALFFLLCVTLCKCEHASAHMKLIMSASELARVNVSFLLAAVCFAVLESQLLHFALQAFVNSHNGLPGSVSTYIICHQTVWQHAACVIRQCVTMQHALSAALQSDLYYLHAG